jgi:hypothetical protein
MAKIEFYTASTAAQFLEKLRLSRDEWTGKLDYRAGWIFRGHNDADWKLLPQAFREELPDHLVKHRKHLATVYAGSNWKNWAKPPARRSLTELPNVALDALTHSDLVRRFVLFADYVKHPVTVQPYLWHLHSEDVKSWTFPKKPSMHCNALALIFNGGLKDLNVEMFAVAAHHGIATQFLDWTYNPLVAAHFAARGRNTSKKIAVWALREQVFDSDWDDITRMTVRAGVTPFLDAQLGLFTWCPTAYLLRLKHGQYVPFEQILKGMNAPKVPEPFLRKITLPVSEVSSLRKLLWRERITDAHLMPTFDNIKVALEMETEWLKP